MTSRLARIIALVNQKGGPGKITLAMHLAGESRPSSAGAFLLRTPFLLL